MQATDISPKMFVVGIRGLSSRQYAAMEDPVVGTYFTDVVQDITWNANVVCQLTEGTMLYAAMRKGFKSGGQACNAALFTQAIYNPEYVRDTEIGVKPDITGVTCRYASMPPRRTATVSSGSAVT